MGAYLVVGIAILVALIIHDPDPQEHESSYWLLALLLLAAWPLFVLALAGFVTNHGLVRLDASNPSVEIAVEEILQTVEPWYIVAVNSNAEQLRGADTERGSPALRPQSLPSVVPTPAPTEEASQ